METVTLQGAGNKTDYAGIDYGMGQSNIDKATGIRYGVIAAHEVGQVWYDESEAYYPNVCPYCGNNLDEQKAEDTDYPEKCEACNKELKEWDFDEQEPTAFYIGNGEYVAEQGTDGDSDIFVMQSPYYTYCQFCSPCAPGAGYLMNYMDKDKGIKAYCFGHEWFEEQETGNMVECQYCQGTGLRNNKSIVQRQFQYYEPYCECWVCDGKGEVKETVSKAPYPVYSVETSELIEA